MLGFLQRHRIGMINLLAYGVIGPAMRAARELILITGGIERRQVRRQHGRIDAACEPRHDGRGCRRRRIALAHHDPAYELEDDGPALLAPRRVHVDDAGRPTGILLEADHFRNGSERVTRVNGFQKAAVGITEIGNGIERDIRAALAEHSVKDDEVVHRRVRIADRLRKGLGGLHRKPGAIKPIVESDIAERDGSRAGVRKDLSDLEVLEKIADLALVCGHGVAPSAAMASAMATVRWAILTCSSSTMRPATVMTPLPAFSGSSKAAMIWRARARSASVGANTRLASATWSG